MEMGKRAASRAPSAVRDSGSRRFHGRAVARRGDAIRERPRAPTSTRSKRKRHVLRLALNGSISMISRLPSLPFLAWLAPYLSTGPEGMPGVLGQNGRPSTLGPTRSANPPG
ncbi:Os03g0618433 [Oryza sativa Japonica Group]|uniref:Os03g0618433 protein n=1 Tax=Oryza sativa subsp. japonica TaxID=39947 RepID=A0A0P0W079_ORYSJ|nr:Os03g0618433 [Oryza sativa Japonica Group]